MQTYSRIVLKSSTLFDIQHFLCCWGWSQIRSCARRPINLAELSQRAAPGTRSTRRHRVPTADKCIYRRHDVTKINQTSLLKKILVLCILHIAYRHGNNKRFFCLNNNSNALRCYVKNSLNYKIYKTLFPDRA